MEVNDYHTEDEENTHSAHNNQPESLSWVDEDLDSPLLRFDVVSAEE
jgi:hypothetical protein